MGKKIKLVYVISNMGIGGAQVLLLNLLKVINNLNIFEITVITLNSGYYISTIKDMGIKVYDLKSKSLINPFIFYNLYRLLIKIDPDIVHTHLLKADFYGRISAKIVGIKYIVSTYHTNTSTHKNNKSERKTFTDYIDNFAIKFSQSHIIAVSEKVKKYINCKINNLHHDVLIIENGIDTKNIIRLNEIESKELKRQLSLSETDYIITFVGRLEVHKGIDFFVESIGDLLKKNINIKILIIGSGNLEKQIREYIIKYDLSNQIYLLGFKSDIYKYIQISNLIVVPSVVEGFGIIILESMLYKIPVLASDAGAIPEIIKDKYNGFMFKSKDKESLLESLQFIYNNKLFNDLTSTAHRHVLEKYDIRKISLKYVDFYKSLF